MVHFSSLIQLRRGLLVAGMCLALSACENPFAGAAPSRENVLSTGWLFSKLGIEPADLTLEPVQPLYCYETIGGSDCYDQPLEDGGNRLVGFEGPAPEM